MTSMRKTTALKAFFAHKGPPKVVLLGLTPRHARMAESLGMEAFIVGAAGTIGGILGRPDNGTITMTESVMVSRWFADATTIPGWTDTDACFGGPAQVERAVQEFIRAGVGGVVIEDQPLSVKRFGGAAEKRVVPLGEAVEKYRAALAVRDSLDPDFQVIARCDALTAVNGGGLDGTIDRLQAYQDAGVDVAHLESPRSSDEISAVRQAIRLPMYVTDYLLPETLSVKEAGELGLAAIIPLGLTAALDRVIFDAYRDAAAGEVGQRIKRLTAALSADLRDEDLASDLVAKMRWALSWTGSGVPAEEYKAARPLS
jgi:2-methylisocitrate lyase-like PEP mutase family enzyme